MKVMKFGGTSVGSPQRIRDVASLIATRGKNLIVLSAMSGTTNRLVEIARLKAEGLEVEALDAAAALERHYAETVSELFPPESEPKSHAEAMKRVDEVFDSLRHYIGEGGTEGEILSCGELISTWLMVCELRRRGLNVAEIPALSFMVIDENGEPVADIITRRLKSLLDSAPDADIYITQGFICRDRIGDITNLERGGSDYTASIAGALIGAEEVQIWTDIDGMHNNDPRFVEDTRPVDELHFEEAAELAYFGAKILHPTCVLPAKNANVPVRLLNTMQPDARGTLIYNTQHPGIKAVAAKDNITAIKIKSGRMLMAYGFLRRVFEVFETYRTAIDLIATSEVGVSLTIDDETHLDAIVADLRRFGTVTVDRNMTIVSVVGDLRWQNKGFEAAALDALRDIPVRIISYGGSNYNISFLISASDKVEALRSLSRKLFS